MSYSPSQLLDVIAKNRDRKLAVSKIIESNPKQLPIVPKLIRDKNVTNIEENRININRGILESMHNKIESNRQNNKNIIKLFPDIEMAIQILVSYILSPKKMTDTQLNYKFKKGFESSPALSSVVLECIKNYTEEEHELEDKLAEIVREALFSSGSYCMAVIPEAAVDEVINADILATYSTEQFQLSSDKLVKSLTAPKHLRRRPAAESTPLSSSPTAQEFVQYLASESMTRMTDNLGVLRFSELKTKISEQLMRRADRLGQSVSLESVDKIGYLDLFRERGSTGNSVSNVQILKERDETRRKSIGKPMAVRFPSGSTIPVCVPGNEKEHIAYLVLLDEEGKPFNIEAGDKHTDDTNANYGQSNAATQTPIQIAYRNLINDSTAKIDVGQLYDMYRDILERQIYSSIKGSLYGSNFEIAGKNDIYFMMFSRALSEQKTNILFVPKTQMTYFAFYYNEYGVGTSLLDNLSTLSSLRAMLLFSSVMAQSKQAIDVTRVNIQLDPSDQDPEKTIAQIQDSVLKMRQNFFPLGINNPVDLVNWIQRAGLQFAYSNNPLIPDVKIDFENANLTHTVPDTALEDNLRKQTLQGLGLSPETVDSGFAPDFATSVINNNVLLAKRMALYQKTLSKHISKFVGQIVFSDQELRTELKTILQDSEQDVLASLTEEEKGKYTVNKEEFIEDYLDALSQAVMVELPKQENTNLTSMSAEFELYKAGLDTVIDSIISTEIFTEDLTGEITNHIDSIKSVFKHHLLREWCANNNYYPEAMALSNSATDEVDTLIDVISKHLTTTMRSSSTLLTVMKKFKAATHVDLNNALGDEAGESSFTASSGSSGGGSEGNPEGGDTGEEGGADMSGDDLLDL